MTTLAHPGFLASSASASASAERWHLGPHGWPRGRDGAPAIAVVVTHAAPLVKAGLLSVLEREVGLAVSEGTLASGEFDDASPAGRVGHRVLIADYESAMEFLAMGDLADPERPRLLIVTRHDTPAHVASALAARADGYFVLGGPVAELVDCIRTLAAGGRPICEVATRRQAPFAQAPTFESRRPPATTRTLDADALEARLAEARQPIEPDRARPIGGLAPGALRRVREHMEQRLAEKIELRELAAIAKLSECHFSRAFKQSVGMPPHRYLLQRRIDAASELIRSTNRSLTEISLDLGFSDQSHFTRTFARTTGETPRAFRHRHR